MTRDEVKAIFGEDITDEQISNLLNKHNSELAKEKAKTKELKDKVSVVDDLQKQLDEINESKMTDIEKANAEKDKALASVEALQTQIKTLELRSKFAEKGIVGEDADKLIASLNSGSFDVETLGNIITARESSAVSNFEKQALQNMPNPQGAGSTETKSEAEKIAETIGKDLAVGTKTNDIVNAYL
jgi:hypothetical protein